MDIFFQVIKEAQLRQVSKAGDPLENGLLDAFKGLRRLIGRYEGHFTAKMDFEGRYELWAVKGLIIEGRKRKEVFFASAIIQSTYVGFYFMPVYLVDDMKALFGELLLKLLKGRSCFHIKTLDEELEKQLSEALEKGFELYRQIGWTQD